LSGINITESPERTGEWRREMAKKKSKTKIVLILGILALAVFGACKLYHSYKSPVVKVVHKVGDVVKAAHREIAK